MSDLEAQRAAAARYVGDIKSILAAGKQPVGFGKGYVDTLVFAEDRSEIEALVAIFKAPYRCTVVGTLDRALSHLRNGEFDVTLIVAKEFDEAADNALRRLGEASRLRNHPLFWVTSREAQGAPIERAYTAGTTDVLSAPWVPQQMRARVASYVKSQNKLVHTKPHVVSLGEDGWEVGRFFDLSAELFCVATVEGKFKRVNPAFVDTLGYSEDELTSLPWLSFVHPDDRVVTNAVNQGVWQGVDAHFFENRYRHKNGSYRWFRWSTRFDRDSQLVYCAVRDITDSKIAENVLRERDSHLRLVMDAAPLLISYIKPDRTFSTVNRAHQEWFGSRDDEYDRCVAKVFGRESYRYIRLHLDLALFGKESTCGVFLPHREKGQRYVHATFVPDFDDEGEVRGCFSFIIDKTIERQAVENLRKSNEHLCLTHRAAKIVSWEHDFVTDAVSWSGDVENLYGFRARSYEEWISCLHPEDAGRIQGAVRSSIEYRREFNAEFRVIKPDKSVRWLESKGRVVWESERPLRMLGITFDVTARKDAEEALKVSEARFRMLAESIPQLVWVISLDHEAEYLNQRWFSYTGMGECALPTTQWYDFLHPDDLERTMAMWEEAKRTQVIFSAEVRVRRADGLYRWHLAQAVPLQNQGEHVTRWLGTHTDIHDHKTHQEELSKAKNAADAANRLKSDFLANMSHEIRTPLGAIMGFSELLLVSQASEGDRFSYVETIKRNGQLLSQIIDDILDLSKVESGQFKVEHTSCSLSTLIHDITILLHQKAREKGIYLRFAYDDKMPERVSTDALRLKQILINIVGNAIKFTHRGGVEVKVKLCPRVAGSPQIADLSFEVIDTGHGIAKKHQEQIFQPFCQADASTTRKFGGTGLGLALSRRLAQALGGDISLAHSVPSQGSSFLVKIAVGVAPNIPIIEQVDERLPPERNAGQAELAGMRILVVDDAPDNQFLIRQMLRGHGAQVDLAENGNEALQKACEHDYDLVLMDLQMPICDGFEATHLLRRRGYDKPILAVSAAAMKEERTRALEAGCDDHITKPVSMHDLVSRILTHADRGRAASSETSQLTQES